MKLSFGAGFLPLLMCGFFLFGFSKCQKEGLIVDPDDGTDTTSNAAGPDIEFYLTRGDQSVLFTKQPQPLQLGQTTNGYPDIVVDTTMTYQTIDGFGFTLTDGSALLIDGLPERLQDQLLQELFGSEDGGIRISYLRISIGASDLSPTVYTYNDLPSGEIDVELSHFDLRKDQSKVVPILQRILEINPDLKIMGSPWTAPVWMKDNNSSVGGSLLPQFYAVYADYFVKYIQAMAEEGIRIDAITPQNEPLHGGNNPSMVMTAEEQADFIKNHLGPAFEAHGIDTKIIIYDHNADRTDYPLTILQDPDARSYIDGSAFHLYGGQINALSAVHQAFPQKNLYFTEQYVSTEGQFGGDLRWHMKNVIVGSMRNWCRVALQWNLASDPDHALHTPGGCAVCLGGVTIISGYTRNVGYYIVAHASRFVIPGSVRVASNISGSLHNVAFVRPDGKKVLIVVNDDDQMQSFNIVQNGKRALVALDEGAVGTFVW